jgi:uncharacterized protein YhfF
VIDCGSNPVCVVRTTNIEIIPFDEVPEDHTQWGGDGDCSLESWRRMYCNYIVLECERIGREPVSTAPMIMERFAVVYPSHCGEVGEMIELCRRRRPL